MILANKGIKNQEWLGGGCHVWCGSTPKITNENENIVVHAPTNSKAAAANGIITYPNATAQEE